MAQRVGLVEDVLEIRAEGSIDGVASALETARSPMLLVDAEGAECYLLDSLRVPVFARSKILAEYHDFWVGGARQISKSRF